MKQTLLPIVLPPDIRPTARVLALIVRGGCWRAADVRERTGMAPEVIGACLASLSVRGLIEEVDPGLWEATEAGKMEP